MINLCKELNIDYQIFQEIRPELRKGLIEENISTSYLFNLPYFNRRIRDIGKKGSLLFWVSNSIDNNHAKTSVYGYSKIWKKGYMNLLDEIPFKKRKNKYEKQENPKNISEEIANEILLRSNLIKSDYLNPLSEEFRLRINIYWTHVKDGMSEIGRRKYEINAFWDEEVIRRIEEGTAKCWLGGFLETKDFIRATKRVLTVFSKEFHPDNSFVDSFINKAIVNINNLSYFISLG